MILRALMLGAAWLVSQTALGEQNRYQCSYYLFEVPATVNGCSDCYVPLLVAQGPIEAQRDQEVVVITTYERDSIWQVQRQVLKYTDLAIELPVRKIKFGGKIYRYQWVDNTEPIRLLKNPLGTSRGATLNPRIDTRRTLVYLIDAYTTGHMPPSILMAAPVM